MPLCRCSVLYQRVKFVIHDCACSTVANGLDGYSGRYLSVRNRASENGLSSLTLGRLKEATTPRRCNVASIVEPFIGLPLSECSTRPRGSSRSCAHVRRNSSDASTADSCSSTDQPTILRLQTSSNTYR